MARRVTFPKTKENVWMVGNNNRHSWADIFGPKRKNSQTFGWSEHYFNTKLCYSNCVTLIF